MSLRWTLVAAIAGVLLLTGCGGTSEPSTDAVNADLSGLISDNLGSKGTVDSVSCVKESKGHYTCIVKAYISKQNVTVTGSYTCDKSNCIWKADA